MKKNIFLYVIVAALALPSLFIISLDPTFKGIFWGFGETLTNAVYQQNAEIPGIVISTTLRKLSSKKEGQKTHGLLHATYQIQNNSNQNLALNPKNIQIKYNGMINQETGYDAIPPRTPDIIALNKGKNELSLYFLFESITLSSEKKLFEIIESGIYSR